MNGKNLTTGERLVKIETNMKNIESQNKEQFNLIKEMHTKLDAVIECKACKGDVEKADKKTNERISGMQKVVNRAMIGIIVLLISIVGFLINLEFFKGG